MPDISNDDFAAAADQFEAAIKYGVATRMESAYFVQSDKTGAVFF